MKRETFIKMLTVITVIAINTAFDNSIHEFEFWFVLVFGSLWGILIADISTDKNNSNPDE